MKRVKILSLVCGLLLCLGASGGMAAAAAGWDIVGENTGNTVRTAAVYEAGQLIPDASAVAKADGSDVTSDPTFVKSEADGVRILQPGTYILDGSETVYLLPDKTAPAFVIPEDIAAAVESGTVFVPVGSEPVDPAVGITASDTADGAVNVTAAVDGGAVTEITEPGEYAVTLTAMDKAGNAATLSYTLRAQYDYMLADFEAASDLSLFAGREGAQLSISDERAYRGSASLLFRPDGKAAYPELRVRSDGALRLDEKFSLTMMVYIEAESGDITAFDHWTPGKVQTWSVPKFNEWTKVTIANKNTDNTYYNLGFLIGKWADNAEQLVSADVKIYIDDVRVDDPALGIAGAPVREVACSADGETAAAFDLKTIVDGRGNPVSGTVTNDGGGEVTYEAGSDDTVLLVKNGETYTFTGLIGSVSIRGTDKSAHSLIDTTDARDADLLAVTGSGVTFDYSSNNTVSMPWQGALSASVTFRTDGLLGNDIRRALIFTVAGANNDPVNMTVKMTYPDGTNVSKVIELPSPNGGWGSFKAVIPIPAGTGLSGCTLTVTKGIDTTIRLREFRLTGAESESDDELTFDLEDSATPVSAYTGFTYEGGRYTKKWDNVVTAMSLTFAPFVPAQGGVRVYFDCANDAAGESITVTMTTSLDGVTVTNESGTNSFSYWGAGTRTFWFDVPADADLSGLKLTFTISNGYGSLYVDNIRIAPTPEPAPSA